MDELKLKELMKRNGVDVVIAVSPENLQYSTGVDFYTHRMLRGRLGFAVFTKSDDPLIVVCDVEEGQVKDHSHIDNVRVFIEFKESPASALIEVLKGKDLGNAVIAVERDYLPLEVGEELKKGLPNATFADS